jgi:uncharacterized membrane protein YjgN (DUF898 family)
MSEIPAFNTSIPQNLKFDYVPRPGLVKIMFINFFLNLVTLSIYRFWAKTNVRKHIWSCIHINGEPLEYTGTGVELFKGALMVFGVFILPYIVLSNGLQFYLGTQNPAVIGLQFLFFLMIYVLIGFALYKARKYQLSRTLWRGIRGTLAGSAMTYSLTYFGAMLAKVFSMGWATPVMNTVLQEQIIGDMRFGDAAFKFKGRAAKLYPTYALCWLLSLLALVTVGVLFSQFPHFSKIEDWQNAKSIVGLIIFAIIGFMLIIPMLWSIYTAMEMRTFATYTRFDGAQFKLNATTGSIIWLTVMNLLMLIFTFGIAFPFILQRSVRYVFSRLTLEGAVDIDRISQSMVTIPKTGEGLADAFDLGAW